MDLSVVTSIVLTFMIHIDDGFSLSHCCHVQVQCPNYLTLNQEKPVNDLEFCENLETTEAQIEGGQTFFVFNSAIGAFKFPITGRPFGGKVADALIRALGTDTLLVVNKPQPVLQIGFQFVGSATQA
jgi:hypothetical protein